MGIFYNEPDLPLEGKARDQLYRNIIKTLENPRLSMLHTVKKVSYDKKGKIHCNNGPAIELSGVEINNFHIKRLWVLHGKLMHSLDDFVKYSDTTVQEKLLIKLKYTEDDFGILYKDE